MPVSPFAHHVDRSCRFSPEQYVFAGSESVFSRCQPVGAVEIQQGGSGNEGWGAHVGFSDWDVWAREKKRGCSRCRRRHRSKSTNTSDQGGISARNPDFLGFSLKRLVLGLMKNSTLTNPVVCTKRKVPRVPNSLPFFNMNKDLNKPPGRCHERQT